LSETFDLLPLRFHCTARVALCLDANFLRGRFGKALRNIDRGTYDRLFDPRKIEGPSGLRDTPRPFVLRVVEKAVAAGERFDFGVHLFSVREPVGPLRQAFDEIVEVEAVEGEVLSLPMNSAAEVSRIRVKFLTPTNLKGAGRPEFGVLFARIRDRLSTLRAFYGDGPLNVDFKAIGERASKIDMTRCEVQRIERERFSRRTGLCHSLGGFIGYADYQGDLGEFVPYLEIARWTGVGRQTVWGNGEIACEKF
jgi:hypothetical protein